MKTIFSLDCRTIYSSSEVARQVWQKLFAIYREKGGNLDKMGNMLIDYKTLEHEFEKCLDKIELFWAISFNKEGHTELSIFDWKAATAIDEGENYYRITYNWNEQKAEIEAWNYYEFFTEQKV